MECGSYAQKIAAVSEERTPLAVQEQAAPASVPDQAALLIGNAQPAPQMEILPEVQPRKAVRNEGQQLSVRRTDKSTAQGATRADGPGVGPSTPQVPRAWYVQLAALSERGSAERLTHQTKAAGFPALLYDGGSSDNPRFRVLVGPQSSGPQLNRCSASSAASRSWKGLLSVTSNDGERLKGVRGLDRRCDPQNGGGDPTVMSGVGAATVWSPPRWVLRGCWL